MRLTGIEAVSERLRQLPGRGVKVVKRWAYSEGLEVLAHSQKIVPVDTGALRSSGHVEHPKVEGGRVVVTVGYGGPAVGYALRVHEDLEARHNEGQEAKFLEKGVLSRQGKFEETLAAEIDKELG